jgi:hypothetical protein
MRITGDGNVGIGTGSPGQKLEVGHYGGALSSDFGAIRITNHATNLHATSLARFDISLGDIASGTGSGKRKLIFNSKTTTTDSGTDILCLDGESNNVGIGTNDPSVFLHIVDPNVNSTTELLRLEKANANGDINNASIGYIGMHLQDSNAGGGEVARISYGHTGDNIQGSGSGQNPEGKGKLGFWTSDTGFADAVPVERMTINHKGSVGIGTTSPQKKLHIMQSTDGSQGFPGDAIRIDQTAGGGEHWDIGIDNDPTQADLVFRWNDSAISGYVQFLGSSSASTDTTLLNNSFNFTGQHKTFIKDIPFSQAEAFEGLIVSSNQNKYIKMDKGIAVGANAITISECLPVVSISANAYDKKCFGVICKSEDPEKRTDGMGNILCSLGKELGDTRVYINSVGEGAMWVVNTTGALESGDYITTSNVAGYGQRQDDDILHNYTVAKITMDCDFNPPDIPVQRILKELSNVNYWVKTTYSNVSLEEYSNLAEDVRTTTTEIYYSNEDGEITTDKYNTLESNVQSTYTELTRIIHQKMSTEEYKTEQEGSTLEVRQEFVNVLDEHGQLQWEDDPSGATEKAYKIRYLDTDGNITDEANAVHIAAFVGCTYHCG